jgi:dolichol-phosphate mannosyltransferase
VSRDRGDLARVHSEFADAIARSGRRAEFIYVLDGPLADAEAAMARIHEDRFPVTVLRMAKGFGEATALQVGFNRARGRFVLTIPAWLQIHADVVEQVLARLDDGANVVVTYRHPRNDAWFNRLQSRVFHGLVRRLVGQSFRDMTCGVRGMTLEAARKLDVYGDQHRFIPVIAVRCGYHVVEVPGAQHAENRKLRIAGPGIYLRRLLDVLNIYFLTRFTRKPLRFFGLVGSSIGLVGFAICAYLATAKLLGMTALSGRPLLLLGVLLLVLGVQITSIGLLGEIIIFLSARREQPEVAETSQSSASPDTQAAGAP